MEFGKIERCLKIDASPETVFEVITSPEHLEAWWPDEAMVEPVPGSVGHLVFGDRASDNVDIPEITVVDADPPRLFSFRWLYPNGDAADATNSLLVTFELTGEGPGTVLRMTETGFREVGWETAVLEEQYRSNVSGWDHFLPRLATYAPTVTVSS